MAVVNTFVTDRQTVHRVSWQQKTGAKNKNGQSHSQNDSQLIKNLAVCKFTAVLQNDLPSRKVSEMSERLVDDSAVRWQQCDR
jgi:hypothetical protein